jgi:hypothetical protein
VDRGRASRGFTIIELSIVVLVMVAVVGGVAFGIANLRRADLGTTTGQIDSAARYLYRRASLTGQPQRMVFDLDHGKWWAEELDLADAQCQTFAVRDVRRKETKVRSELEARQQARQEKKAAEAECPKEARDPEGRCPPKGFRKVAPTYLLPSGVLAKGLRFSGVMTTHQQERQDEGTAYVYFFPDGSVEKAYIYLSSDEDTFTVETFPLMGKVKVHPEELEASRFLNQDNG